MTSISPTTDPNSLTSTTTTNTTSSGSTSTSGASTLGEYDDFLTLLTAQLKNQDPLNPADGTEFVAQIATFTQVEQQIATVERLDKLISLTSSNTLTELGTWLGKSVSTEEASLFFGGSPVTVATPAETGATKAELVIRDAEGREIRTIEASPSGGNVTWDGADSSGGTVPVGSYSAEMRFTKPGENGGSATTTTKKLAASGVVKEARLENGAGVVVLDNGFAIPSDKITGVSDNASDS